jgi:hypothetical protein
VGNGGSRASPQSIPCDREDPAKARKPGRINAKWKKDFIAMDI